MPPDFGDYCTYVFVIFERLFGDKKRFQAVMDLVNDRPDTHAKEIDSADVALYRRELSWLESKVLS